MTVRFDEKHILQNADAEAGENEADPGSDIREPATNWRSIYIASALSFIGSAQFTLYFSSMWPYLQIIDRSITESFFGYIIAIYSLGQIFASPLFGYISNRMKTVRPLLFVGLLLMFIGNATYLALETITYPKRYLLLVGRLITGAGSGNVLLLRTYASTASTAADRSKAIAFITCGQAVGLTSGPALQLFFTALHYPGPALPFSPSLHINLYTAPAYLACLMNLFGAIILYFWFREEYAGLAEGSQIKCIDTTAGERAHEKCDAERAPKILSLSALTVTLSETAKARRPDDGAIVTSSSLPSQLSTENLKLPAYDIIAVFVCLLTRFTYMFINTNLETIGSPYSMMMFAWTESWTVFYTSLAQGGIGLLTLSTYVAWITLRLERYLSYRVGCVVSLVSLAAFHLITYSWPFFETRVPIQNNITLWTLDTMDSAAEPVGCNAERFEWCYSLTSVNVWLYYVTYVLTLGLAFPVLNVTNSTLYADVLGPRRQGTQQGVLQMAGGTARLLGPIVISSLYSAYGPTMAWKMEVGVIAITLLLWLLFYRRMIPLMKRHRLKTIGSATPSPVRQRTEAKRRTAPTSCSAPYQRKRDNGKEADVYLSEHLPKSKTTAVMITSDWKTASFLPPANGSPSGSF